MPKTRQTKLGQTKLGQIKLRQPKLGQTEIRQTNRVMKVGNKWVPAFLNLIDGVPTYTYLNDSGQWTDASGNTYSVILPLDEVTVKYDPATNG